MIFRYHKIFRISIIVLLVNILLLSGLSNYAQIKFVSKETTNIYPTSENSQTPLIQLKKGSEVCLVDEQMDGWAFIRYRKHKGYVNSDDLGSNNPLLNDAQRRLEEQETVYVCTGPTAYAYHKISNCFRVLQCSEKIITCNRREARGMCRTPCGDCY